MSISRGDRLRHNCRRVGRKQRDEAGAERVGPIGTDAGVSLHDGSVRPAHPDRDAPGFASDIIAPIVPIELARRIGSLQPGSLPGDFEWEKVGAFRWRPSRCGKCGGALCSRALISVTGSKRASQPLTRHRLILLCGLSQPCCAARAYHRGRPPEDGVPRWRQHQSAKVEPLCR